MYILYAYTLPTYIFIYKHKCAYMYILVSVYVFSDAITENYKT